MVCKTPHEVKLAFHEIRAVAGRVRDFGGDQLYGNDVDGGGGSRSRMTNLSRDELWGWRELGSQEGDQQARKARRTADRQGRLAGRQSAGHTQIEVPQKHNRLARKGHR